MQHSQTHNSTQKLNRPPLQEYSLHPVIKRLFEKREFENKDIEQFLSWDLKKLPNLTSLHDMPKAVERIISALDNNETIGIYGDYDVDGTTSCALLFHFFNRLGHPPKLFQPSRFIEGYGIHPPAIDKAINDGVKVLITVDCGITNNEAAAYSNDRGLDLIITDHHKDANEQMPPAYAVINPNRRDEPDNAEMKSLAGVTVGFALAVAVREELLKRNRPCESIYDLLQFVAIGTICDLAKLTPANLKLVRHGLKLIKTTKYPGLKSFFPPEERKARIIPSEKLSFNVGPLINSKGRLDHPEMALKLLTSDDQTKANHYYSHLEVCNNERKVIQNEVFNEAKDEVVKEITDTPPVASIVYAPHWHEGVIGIVASKLVETFKTPAIVFTDAEEEGIIKASARSAGELNLFELLNNQKDLFIKFGGHKAAAGLSMTKENFEKFKSNIIEEIAKFPIIERTLLPYYDLEIQAKEISPKLVRELELLEPFGMGNEKPIFKTSDIKLDSYDILKDVHIRWNFVSTDGSHKRLKGISFNYLNKYGLTHPEEIFEIQNQGKENVTAYFTLGINRWNGNEYIQLMVDRVESASFYTHPS